MIPSRRYLLQPSNLLTLFWLVTACLALVLAWDVQLPLVLQLGLTALIPWWTVTELRREAWRLSPDAVVALRLDVSGEHQLTRQDGTSEIFEPRMIYCSELLLAISAKTAKRNCHLLVPRDALLNDDYRRLKVRLGVAGIALQTNQSSPV